jgi:diaminopimelate decarboxylase
MGELMMATKAGINPKKIVFSGVGKTSQEINYAIDKKILLINAESESEIKEIDKIAKLKKKKVKIGIRLNPNTDAKTLSQISTGKKENKFGVNDKTFIKLVNYCKNSKNIDLKCLSVHIGSQILNHKPYEKMLKVIDKIINKANHKFEFIDLGGGMGISYNDNSKKLNYKKYNIAINKFLKIHKSKIIFEPGRSVIGNTGSLISKVIYLKKSERKDFVILDAAMNDLMRPALYGASHKILPSLKTNKNSKKTYEFVGPICESTDKFATLKKFQELKEKDLIVMCDVGAYGMSLSSNYNIRPKPIELLIKGSKIKIIRKRQKHKDLM